MSDVTSLKVITDLLAAFHEGEVSYCHWKSNQHLDASMEGATDLDVLVGRGQTDVLNNALAVAGYKRFQPIAGTAYPGVEDYIGFDDETGKIVHLHLHHFLTLGEPHLKGYRLPWEGEALRGRIHDETFGIYTTSREMELLLLLVRQVLKRRLRGRIAGWMGLARESKNFRNEYNWLAERVDRDAMLELAGRLMDGDAIPPLGKVLDSAASSEALGDFNAVVRRFMKPHRSFTTPSALVLQKLCEFAWVLGGISKRKVPLGIPLRRVNPRGGLVIAFLGSDGAGKSTLLADTGTWLGQKLDVFPLYLGSGDGSASLLRLPLKLARRVIEGSVDGSAKTRDGSGEKRQTSTFRKLGKLPWALSLAAEKRSKLRRMVRARNRGLVVICDRYPQNQTKGFNDGPLLDAMRDAEQGWLRRLSEWEAGAYDLASKTPPDIVIKLVPSVEIAMQRRPELPREEIERRINAVRSFEFREPARVHEIDADQPLDQVIVQVRRVIWDQM